MQSVKEHFNKIPFNKGYLIKEHLNKSLFNFVRNGLISSFAIDKMNINKPPGRAVTKALPGGK